MVLPSLISISRVGEAGAEIISRISHGTRVAAGTVESRTAGARWEVIIDPGRCKGCGICVAACPMGNLRLSEGVNSLGYHYVEWIYEGEVGPCTGCAACYWVCPEYSILEVVRSGGEGT